MRMKRTGETRVAGPVERLGMGLGFFRSYADSFWRATGMELDLVHADGEPWNAVAKRVRGEFCRDRALRSADAGLCGACFRNACRAALTGGDFHTASCHAGQSFSVCPLGEINGAGVLLLTGRVLEAETTGATFADGGELPPRKSPSAYRGALDLIKLSLPYLKLRLDVDLLSAAREYSPTVRNACHYVDTNFREKIAVPEVAAACGVSADHLSRLFSKQTDNTLGRYISAVRIGHAMYLLRDARPGIAEIAYEVGFQSLSQFNRTFLALRGMSPGEFRKTERAGG